MPELILLLLVLWQLHRLSQPGVPMNLLQRLLMVALAVSVFRVIGHTMT
jgi:hypothetical protein